jgi:hypothetical protein
MQTPDFPPQQPGFDCGFLTVEQFAARLHVSRATVFGWMQRGVLQAGRHYVKFGRVLRFPWSPALVAELLHASSEQAVSPERVRPTPRQRRPVKGSPVNWDY